ncbi:hypothetical protein EJB05_03071, partial [Eragrostis curvula]
MESNAEDPWEYSLRKYLLLLATLVATVTYAAGFNPPGGVWQDTDEKAGHLAGDPIIRDTSYPRYLAFFYCNATAFALSLVVILLILILSMKHDRAKQNGSSSSPSSSSSSAPLQTLRVVMVLDLLSLMAAYAAGTWRDTLTTVCALVLLAGAVVYVAVILALAWCDKEAKKNDTDLDQERLRKVLMLLATFAVSVTYVAGLSAPGGFWDNADDGHRPGHAVLKGGRHDGRLKAFFVCNTTAFVASLLIVVLLLDKKLKLQPNKQQRRWVRSYELYGFIVVALLGLVGAYSAGSCREIDTTMYVIALIGAVLLCILIQVAAVKYFGDDAAKSQKWTELKGKLEPFSDWVKKHSRPSCWGKVPQGSGTSTGNGSDDGQRHTQALEKARSLVLLLATLAAAITYQAGLDPPGGLWQEDGDGYMAGDPILLTRNPKRFKAFYYCNSVAFVASLVAILLVRKTTLHKHNALEAAMILDLFGLIGAYAAGSCRDVNTSIYAMALAGVVLVYVVIHVVFFTLGHHEVDNAIRGMHDAGPVLKKLKEEFDVVDKRRKRLLLFAILAATITYQAGLTPPSGFRLQDDESGHRAGDPVLLYNSSRRYKAFFYCNSCSYGREKTRPNQREEQRREEQRPEQRREEDKQQQRSPPPRQEQRPKSEEGRAETKTEIRSEEGRAETGGRRQTKTEESSAQPGTESSDPEKQKKELHSKRKFLMLLGILVASVTYQSGLKPPGGVWQSDGVQHNAGNPVMHDNRRPRYLAFFYSNSTSFVASIVVIILLLRKSLLKKKWWLGVMNTTIVLDLLGLLVAYAAGSSRSWKTSGYVSALVIAVLGYFVIHVALSCITRSREIKIQGQTAKHDSDNTRQSPTTPTGADSDHGVKSSKSTMMSRDGSGQGRGIFPAVIADQHDAHSGGVKSSARRAKKQHRNLCTLTAPLHKNELKRCPRAPGQAAPGGRIRRRAPARSAMAKSNAKDPWEYSLRKYLLLLATLVATVTYAAGFNPPGGVWQDTNEKAGRLAGDPIIRDTSYPRYLAFFYCNATAFALSLVVIVLILILSVTHDRGSESSAPLHTLRVVMVLDLLSVMGAYAAGTCRDTLTAAYASALVGAAAVYVAVNLAVASWRNETKDDVELDKLRKVLMLLATFAVSVTYVAGLSAPGGFWDDGGIAAGHRPGHAVLKGGRHDGRLKAFFVCNTTAFVASLLIVFLLLNKKLQPKNMVRYFELYAFIIVALVGLVAAYSAGSCREIDTTIYVNALIGAVILCVLLQVLIVHYFKEDILNSSIWNLLERNYNSFSKWVTDSRPFCWAKDSQDSESSSGDGSDDENPQKQATEKAGSLVLLLATLAAAITYQAGLDPPGGLWQEDGIGYIAGDPILLTRNPRRYKAFYYCNSVAFVASLVAIIMVRKNALHKHNALEAAMILDLFGLIGAYAAGSCRDVNTSVYAMALAGAVLVYVVIHVVFFTMDHHDVEKFMRGMDDDAIKKLKDELEVVEKRRKRLLLFAILAATITYQAGLTPPSGFRLEDDVSGHHAGDPVLLYNSSRRYKAFFYCNSVSFMLSIALIILLVNKNLYRPAIRSNALSVCTGVGMCGLVGAYAAGSTQHFMTSIYIFAVAGVVLLVGRSAETKTEDSSAQTGTGTEPGAETTNTEEGRTEEPSVQNGTGTNPRAETNADQGRTGEPNAQPGTESSDPEKQKKKLHAKRKYLMLLGILVASVTYQAGLAPPGGVWQSDDNGHAAGNPVMHDNRHPRYLAFFYSNSISFVASIVVVILLLPESLHKAKWSTWWLTVMNTTIVLDLLGLLVAYAAGSSRSWKTSGYVSAIVIAVLGYFVIHVALSCFSSCGHLRGRVYNSKSL